MTQLTSENKEVMVKNEKIEETSEITTGVKPKKARSKATGKTQNGSKAKAQKKIKGQRSEDPDSEVDCTMRLTVKEEPDNADFVTEKRGKKRKRLKEEEEEEEAGEGPSKSHKSDKKFMARTNNYMHWDVEPTLPCPSVVKKKKRTGEEDGEAASEKKRKSEGKLKKPKKEPKESSDLDKVKRIKEEREAARALKLKLKEEEEQQRWRW
ncbi:hypothetical protein AALO_G00153720 [Alosa alosa]|uniref:Uncharacterized protein n=1 Tax=Alosa alosa TaxID=278164 RepID=A0AAV6GHY4_9TELE|nr:hypothetical protein AALO_G00153720 [Alosa alosa]